MSLKMKLTSAIIAFMLLASMLIVGVFAVKQTEFSVGGNIVFNATGIDATISAGTLSTTGSWRTGDGTGKMEEVVIDTDKSASDLATKYATWSGLDLAFNEAGDDVTITFTITNNSTNADDSLVAYVNIDSGTSKNAVAYVENAGAVIAPNTTDATDENVEEFVITFHVLDKEVNASLEGFKIDFEIRYAMVEVEMPEEAWFDLSGEDFSFRSDGMLTDEATTTVGVANITTTGNAYIPAYVKAGERIYTVNSFKMSPHNSNIKVFIPNTVVYIDQGYFSGVNIESIILPSSVTSIGYAAFVDSTLKEIYMPSGVTIGAGAFSDSLLVINFMGTQDEWAEMSGIENVPENTQINILK